MEDFMRHFTVLEYLNYMCFLSTFMHPALYWKKNLHYLELLTIPVIRNAASSYKGIYLHYFPLTYKGIWLHVKKKEQAPNHKNHHSVYSLIGISITLDWVLLYVKDTGDLWTKYTSLQKLV